MNFGKKILPPILLAFMVTSSACAETASTSMTNDILISNKEKPVVWFNRQPSNSETGELDYEAITFNKNTYYVGVDMEQGATLQGEMLIKYISGRDASLDRNGDGIIGYVLAIGDSGHNISAARTRGARKACGTAVKKNDVIIADAVELNLDGSSNIVTDGSITIGEKEYIIRELASKEMTSPDGATWNADAAGVAINEWVKQFGDSIDIIISNNDGMGLKMFDNWAHTNGVPVFGYDANGDCVAAIKDGFCGSISQRAEVQAYMTLRILRNCLDGVDINTGIGTIDEAGNVLNEADFYYAERERAFKALNLAVTKDNYQYHLDPRATYDMVSHQLNEKTHPKKKVWINIYSDEDDFLSQTYQPLLQQYAYTLNLDITIVIGNGYDESSITSQLPNPSAYDAFAINMIKTDNAHIYMDLLSK
ncbi:MAG: substrate-binding domain-containing protein [Butyrivibrio sp.]|nr:substrate-binding domain-containing protein [Butyrivibrio sp.]